MYDVIMPATTDITQMGERGQVQVPAWVRERLSLQPGQRFVWRVLADGDLHIHVVRQDVAARRAQWRAYAQGTQGGRSSDEILAEARADEAEARRDLGL